MVEAYEILDAALCKAYGIAPLSDIMAHFEWAPTRKIDPWGGNSPTPGFSYTGPFEWHMNGLRQNVQNRTGAGPPPEEETLDLYSYPISRRR